MRKNKGKLSRFFFRPFLSVLRVFAPHAPQTQEIPERYFATTAFSPPRVASETLRGAYAQIGGSKFQRQTANATNLPQFWAARAAIQTLRGAYASLEFLFPKFSRPKLAKEGSKDKPRIQRTYHNFGSIRPPSKRCVAPMPKFSRPKLAKEGSKDKPRIQRTYHNFGSIRPPSKRCVEPMLC